MGNNIVGFKNENEMIDYLNNKKIIELNENMKNFILSIYNDISLNSIVKAAKIGGQLKSDFYIEINNIRKNISLKMGTSNSIHQESLETFCDFLNKNNVSQNSIQTIKLYHYGDGTIDGTGINRLTSKQFCLQNLKPIDACNNEINKNKNLLIKLFNRFIFDGIIHSNTSVDIVYHGTINEGKWASKYEIIDYLLNEKSNHEGIHFSNLTYQVWNRCINYNPKMEKRRHIMQIKWSTMLKDIIRIINRRNVSVDK